MCSKNLTVYKTYVGFTTSCSTGLKSLMYIVIVIIATDLAKSTKIITIKLIIHFNVSPCIDVRLAENNS